MSVVEDQVSSELIQAAKQGDRLAQHLILFRMAKPLQARLAERIPATLRGVISPDDLLQETFLKAIASLQQLRSNEPVVFQCWLKSIADTELATVVRRAQQLKHGGRHCIHDLGMSTSVVQRGPGPLTKICLREADSRLVEAVKRLPRPQRQVVELRYRQGLKYAEVAQAMQKSEGAVRNLLLRARRSLGTIMKRPSLWID